MKLRKMLSLLLICILLSGCWDKVEIDKKSIISIIGVDVGEDICKQKEMAKQLKPDEPYTSLEMKKLHSTLGTPDISKLGPDKGGTAEDIYISAEGYSMQDTLEKASLKSSRDIRFSHTKLLVLSSELMGYPDIVKEVIDYLQREPSLNRMMYVVLAEGKPEEYIKYKPSMEKSIEGYISGLVENSNRNEGILPITLNEFLILISENGNALLPRMVMEKDKKELKISGVSIIKNYALKGSLTPSETGSLEMLRGTLKGGKRVTFLNKHPVDYVIDGVDRKISLTNSNGKLSFDINVKLEGEIKDYYADSNIFSKDQLNYLQENFNKSIKMECEQVVRMTQEKFQVDPIGIREYVEKFYPGVWKQKKDNWSEVYKNAAINVNIDTNVRRIGVVK
jgi:Ger(x)C family germination protein